MLPITAIVLVISITIAPLTPGTLLLVCGMGLFTLGVGFFLMVAQVRMPLNIPLSHTLPFFCAMDTARPPSPPSLSTTPPVWIDGTKRRPLCRNSAAGPFTWRFISFFHKSAAKSPLLFKSAMAPAFPL